MITNAPSICNTSTEQNHSDYHKFYSFDQNLLNNPILRRITEPIPIIHFLLSVSNLNNEKEF